MVKSGKVDSQEIDVSELKSGIYFIQIKDEDSFSMKVAKLIKQ